jgi:golgin subfamily B member 1
MGMDELRAALEQNANDTRTFQTFLEPILREGTQEEFDGFLETVIGAIGDQDALANLMRAADFKAKSVGGELRDYVTYRIGKVFQEIIGNEDMAEMYYRRLPADSSHAIELHGFYVEFYIRKENWRKLEQLFQKGCEADGVERPDLQAKRLTARLARERGNMDRALAYWQSLRKEIPNDEEVQQELIDLYERTGKWHQVAEIIKSRADGLPADEAEQKVALYLRLIPIYTEHLRMDAKVAATYQTILKLQPSNEEAFGNLCDHYRQTDRWPDLVKVLKGRIEDSSDEALVFELHREVATIMEEKFSNTTEAMKNYEAMLALAPEDLQVVRKLKELYEQRRDWTSYVSVARTELAALEGDEHDEQLRVLARLALENVRDPAIGVELWRAVRGTAPEDSEAFDALMHLYERSKQFEGVAELLEERIVQVEEDDQRKLLERLATIYASRIGDMDQAAETWQRLLGLDPENNRAQAELKKILVRAKDLSALDSFFRTFGRMRDYQRTLEVMAREEEEPILKAQVLFRVAALYQETEGQEKKAREALENVLAVDPQNVDAAGQLIGLYQTLEAWQDLVHVQDLVLSEKEDLSTEERLDLLLAKALIHEEKLQEAEMAFFTYVSAYQLDWTRSDVHREMERLAGESGNWETYISVLEQTLDRMDDEREQAPYLLRIAEIWELKLDNTESATEYYTRVVAIDDTSMAALGALARLYGKTENWTELRTILEQQLAIETVPDDRKLLLTELGDTCLGRLSDADGAIQAYRSLLTEFPSYSRAYDKLSEVLLGQGRNGELLEVFEARLSALDLTGLALADTLVDIGMLYYSVHEEVLVATDRYIEAINVVGDLPRAVALLEELIGNEDVQFRVARALEPVYEEREAFFQLADVLEIQARWQEGSEQIEILRRLKAIYRQIDNHDAASVTVQRLLRQVPEEEELKLELEELAGKLDDWFPVVALYGEIIEAIGNMEYRHEVMRSAASIYHLQLEDVELAKQLYRSVLDEAPADGLSLAALQGIAFEEEDWQGLLGIYATRKDLEESVEGKIGVMFEIAHLSNDHLEDPVTASTTVEEIIELEPTNVDALRLLDELYTAQEKWEDLLRALDQTCSLASEEEVRVELLLRMAELYERRLEDPDGMVDRLEHVLQIDEDSLAAVEILERNIQGDIALRVLDLLETYFRRNQGWPRLIDLLYLRKSFLDDELDQLMVQKEISRIYEEDLSNLEAAFENYRIALAMSREDEDILTHLLLLAENLANFEELFLVLDEETKAMDDSPQQVQMWRIQATMARDKMDDTTTATEYFMKVMEREPEDLDTVMALASLYRDSENWSRLVDVLEVNAELAPELEDKKALFLELGAIYFGYLENAERAITAYEEIINLDPEDETGLTNLDNLYGETGKWDDLEQILQRRAMVSPDPDEQRILMLRRSEVLDGELERLDDANQVLAELFARNQTDMEVVERLEALHEKREDWLSLLDVLRHKLTLVDEEGHYVILMKIAQTHGHQLMDTHAAVEAYQQVLSRFPDEEGPVEELELLVLSGEQKEAAFDLLKPILEQREQWDRLLMVMEAFKDALEDTERRLELLLEMADIADTRLENLERAFYLAAEGVQTAPHRTDVIDLLEQIGHRAGLLEQVVTVYSETAEAALSTDDALNLLKRKAEVLKNELQDFNRAVEEYEKLREFETDRFVLDALDELYLVLERWDRLAEVLREEIDLVGELDEKLYFYYRLAEVMEENLVDANQACEVLKEAYMLDSERPETLLRLRRLYDEKVGDGEAADLLESYYSSQEEWEEVAAVLERRFNLTEERDDKLELAQKLLSVFLNRLEDKNRSLHYCGEALVIDPEDYATLEQLRSLKDDTGLVEETVGYLQRARKAAEGVEAYRSLGMEAGKLLRQLERFENAEECFREILERDEEHIPSWQQLESLYEEQERVTDHEEVLVMLVMLQDYDDDKIPLLLKLGELRRDRLDNAATAIEAFREVAELDERNEVALNSLASLYEAGEMYDKLTGILGNMVELTNEADERVSLLSRLAGIYEEYLDDREQAIQSWLDVLDWTPQAEHVLANLQRLYRDAEEWQSLVEMAEREANLESVEAERKADLWREIAQVAGEQLEDHLLAQQNWARVAEVVPGDAEAQANLRILYRENEDYMKLATLLEVLASNPEADPDERIGFWTELGQVKMDEVMDPEGAILAWSEVLSLDSGNLPAYGALERLYLENARFEEAVILLGDKLQLIEEDDDKVALLDTVASLLEESLNQWEEAAATRLQIIAIRPKGFEQYERVADIFESHEQWPELARLLESRLEVEEDDEQTIEHLSRLAEIYEEQLQDDQSALGAVVRALELVPGNFDFLDMGERIATRAELWEDLQHIWAASVEHIEDDDRKITMMSKLAALLRDKTEEYDEAIVWYEMVLDVDPEREEALQSLVVLYELTENWEKLAVSLEQLAEVTVNFEKQVEYSLQLGDTWFQKLGQSEKAQSAYRQVLELDPTEEKAVDALQMLYTEGEDWGNLIEVLALRATLHPEEDAELKLISGELLEEKLEEPMRAAEMYEELVTYDPSATEAFSRLERIYTEHEVWDKLSETYEQLLSVTTDDEQRVDILRKLALLNETVIENGEAAADFYQQILDYYPEDLETINSLEQLYEDQDRWDDLVMVLRRTVQLAETVRDKVGYLNKVAQIYSGKLEDIHSAIMAYKEILEHDPGHLETLVRLEELFGEEGDWMEVLNILDLRIQVASDTDEVVGYYLRKGTILRDEMLMLDKAREQYHMALERVPNHTQALDELIEIYEQEEDWEKIIETLLAQARAVEDEEMRASIFARMGYFMKDRMDDPERAIEVFEAALERVPNLEVALLPLAEIYMAREQWEKAFPLLEMLKEMVEEDASPEEAAQLYLKLAKACSATGNRDKALEYYRAAYDRAPDDLDTLEGLAQLNSQQGNYEVAEAYYRSLLEKVEDDLDVDRLVTLYRAMSEVLMNMGRPDSAREFINKVLDLSPNDTGSMMDAVQLMEYHTDWEGAIRYRRQLVDLLTDPLEQWKMLISIGDTYREKLDNLEMAIKAYNEALEAQPYSKSALVKLLEIHINAKAYAEAINILQHLVQVEDSPIKKSSYTFTIATIYRTELNEMDMAVEYYEQTLELNPEKLEAFRGVDELLTESKNWDELEAGYRRMIGRIRDRKMPEVEFTLYRGLGEIYRSRLKQPDMAISSFELACKLKNDDSKIHEILAQLYELQGQIDKAINEHRIMVYLEPERIESYRAMGSLMRDQGQDDNAWFAMAVLAMANKLDDEEKQFYQSKQVAGMMSPRRSLDSNLWARHIFSKAENIHVGEIFQTLYQAIGGYLEGRDPKELGLKKRDELDLREKTVFTTVFNKVSAMLGIPSPKIYLSDRAFGMRIEATIPPILIIGKDMLHGKSEKELAFVIAKNLSFFHPMHVLAACYPAPVLKLLFQVAVKFVHDEAPVDGADGEQFQVLSQHLRKRISPALATTLSNAIDYFWRRQAKPGISKWLTGVELTANHAGLLACQDLPVAAAVLRQESIAFSKLPPREKAKELVLYAISDEFAAVREALGIEL